MKPVKVLIIYYSYSSQTRKLIQSFGDGFAEAGIEVNYEQLRAKEKLQFPLGSVVLTLKMMVETFFRKRVAIVQPALDRVNDVDLVILAGPTWSYNPSGPVLSFLDNYGRHLRGKKILPFISCRSLWRMHQLQIKYALNKAGGSVYAPVVFQHQGSEPWRTIGVFMKLAGMQPESSERWISRFYKRFGHTREQVDFAREVGRRIGDNLLTGTVDLENSHVVIKDISG